MLLCTPLVSFSQCVLYVLPNSQPLTPCFVVSCHVEVLLTSLGRRRRGRSVCTIEDTFSMKRFYFCSKLHLALALARTALVRTALARTALARTCALFLLRARRGELGRTLGGVQERSHVLHPQDTRRSRRLSYFGAERHKM